MPRPKPSSVGTLAVTPVALGTREQAAEYVAALTAELAGLTRRHRLKSLAYLLDLARLEAENIIQGGEKGEPAEPPKAPAR